MAFDYSELAQTALDLVAESGKSVTLVKQSSEPADPQKPWKGNDTVSVETEVSAVIVPISETTITPANALQRDATSVAYVAALSGVDARGVHFLDESLDIRWRVVDVITYAPGSTTLLYILFLVR